MLPLPKALTPIPELTPEKVKMPAVRARLPNQRLRIQKLAEERKTKELKR
jgi:hypothetical protein